MILNFDDFKNKGMKFYKRVARELQLTDDLGYVDRLVTCLLHVIRERVSLEESLNVISILPMHVKGVYVHGWRLNNDPKSLSSQEELLNALRIKYPHTTGRQLGGDEELKNSLRVIFQVLQLDAVSKGVNDIREKLPAIFHSFCEPGQENASAEKVKAEDEHFPEIKPIKTTV